MTQAPEVRQALSSEVLRAFVRGWCRGNQKFARVVCYYLIASAEDLPTSSRAIAAAVGCKESQTRYIIKRFKRAIQDAQAEESMLGLPRVAWAVSLRTEDDR